jgi:hypothetical protein
VFKFVWRLCWKINVVCMSLSPFDSFQSRFVTYLLNCPRIKRDRKECDKMTWILFRVYWPTVKMRFASIRVLW